MPAGSRLTRRPPHFDEGRIDPDCQAVLDAAAFLQVSEFELFRLAYRWWTGRKIDDAGLERHYLPYMFDDVVPDFMRQFLRHLERLEAEGRLDRRDFGLLPEPASTEMYDRGIRYILWLVVIMGVLFTGALAVAELSPWLDNCVVPPCY